MLKRRSFMAGILAACAPPGFISSGSAMKIFVPKEKELVYPKLRTIYPADATILTAEDALIALIRNMAFKLYTESQYAEAQGFLKSPEWILGAHSHLSKGVPTWSRVAAS